MMKNYPVIPLLLAALFLGACEPRDVIEFEIREMIEEDHWSLSDQKTCLVRYKVLNNTKYDIERIVASMVWKDGFGENIKSPMILDQGLAADQATRTGSTEKMYGACADIELVGIRDIYRCDIPGLTKDECEAKFRIIFRE